MKDTKLRENLDVLYPNQEFQVYYEKYSKPDKNGNYPSEEEVYNKIIEKSETTNKEADRRAGWKMNNRIIKSKTVNQIRFEDNEKMKLFDELYGIISSHAGVEVLIKSFDVDSSPVVVFGYKGIKMGLGFDVTSDETFISVSSEKNLGVIREIINFD